MRRTITKLALLGAAAILATAVPALAHPRDAGHRAPSRDSHPTTSHECTAHHEAYEVWGTFVSWSATPGTNGKFTGTITVAVTKANHHAAAAKGTTVTYNLSNTEVTMGNGITAPTTTDHVRLIGKVTAVTHRCSDQSAAGTITIRKVVIHTM